MAGGGQGSGTPQGYAGGGLTSPNFSALSSQLPSVQGFQGPDITGNSSGSNMGYDGSGSDAGVGGQPVNQMQTPVQRFDFGGPVQQRAPAGGFGPTTPQYSTGMVPPSTGGFGQQAPATGGFGSQPAYQGPQVTAGGSMGVMGGPQFNQPQGGSMGVMGGPQFNQPQGGSMGVMGGEKFNQQRAQALQHAQQANLAALSRAQGNRPPSLADFRPQQGLQVHGNPTSQVVQRPQQK